MSFNSRKIWFFARFWIITLSVFIMAEQSTVRAQNAGAGAEARVTSVSGGATLSSNGSSGLKLLKGTILTPGDEIDTRGGGRVVIDLSDGSQVVVLPGSRVLIADYRNVSSLRELLQITLGRVRIRINHFKNQPNPYRVKSPTASIAVRGTEFEVSVEPMGETRVEVINGLVEVSSLKDPKHPLLAEPGRGVIVRPNYTLEFFVSNQMAKETGERDKRKNDAAKQDLDDDDSLRSASSVYERNIENIIENGETPVPARFAAFADNYLDSFENPANASAFTSAEGRVYFIPSLNGVSTGDENVRNRLGLTNPSRPVDYSFLPEASVFVPLKKFRAVIGGSGIFVRNGLQSLTVNENSLLSNPPFPANTFGVRTNSGTTTNNVFNGSLIIARRFGKHDQTSVGFSLERLISRGSLEETITQTNADGFAFNRQISSRSNVNRTRLTFGVTHNFNDVKLSVFYRQSLSSGNDTDRFSLANGVAQPNNFRQADSHSSEFGFRLRGTFSSRLFYGSEGSLLIGNSNINIHNTSIADSTEKTAITRPTLGFGVGYILRPRTVFSFDIAGGLTHTNQPRTENQTGNLLKTRLQNAEFLSLHAAVQKDLWRKFFVSGSILSLTQSRTTDFAYFPDSSGRKLNSSGILPDKGRTRDLFTDFYSDYGTGWRFKPDLIVQYILTTDYGQTAIRHALLFRYTFDLSQK